MFGIFNSFVGSIYPVIASYKAYDDYARVASSSAASSVQIGSVSIPFGTMLKRATAAEGSVEEDYLNSRLLTVQMWLIYWIVHVSIGIAESMLFLTWLPLYSSFRLLVSAWLISPIVLSSLRLNRTKALTPQEVQQEWAGFSTQGCGLVYFQYLKPLFDEQLKALINFNFEPLLNQLARFSGASTIFSYAGTFLLKNQFKNFAGQDDGSRDVNSRDVNSRDVNAPADSSAPAPNPNSPPPQENAFAAAAQSAGFGAAAGHIQNFSNLAKNFQSRGEPAREDLADYDMVNTPSPSPEGQEGVKQRNVSGGKEKKSWW
ncbi:hypothetical protein CA3LBN_001918 [Candidozyma haemuli]|uniref:Protein YOP1 n=2 Tax=Candidozyma TaxID=3303203 RepID=A0ABX8I596_9ASCO|nr:hypothetical protein CA3LBN_001918 [[Candida] haemuloni]